MHAEIRDQLRLLAHFARQLPDELDAYQEMERDGVAGLRLDEQAMLDALTEANAHLNRAAEMFMLAGPPPVVFKMG